VIEADYHAPPVADFGYGRGGLAEGFRDTFESWETAGGGGGYSMNAMFSDGGLQTDYELSNINSVSMTPNGKYAIVGQSQGPPQIWDAIVSGPPARTCLLKDESLLEWTTGVEYARNQSQLQQGCIGL
jgi:hypothetical protein